MSGPVELDLRVDSTDWGAPGPWEALCQAALEAAQGVAPPPRPGQVSVLLTGDDAMRELNARWRGQDKATDVLSFPAATEDNGLFHGFLHGFLGDLALGHGVCAADAAAMGKPLTERVTHLIIHGYLHLIGHDHEQPAMAAEMEALEVEAMARLGLGDPYRVTLDEER